MRQRRGGDAGDCWAGTPNDATTDPTTDDLVDVVRKNEPCSLGEIDHGGGDLFCVGHVRSFKCSFAALVARVDEAGGPGGEPRVRGLERPRQLQRRQPVAATAGPRRRQIQGDATEGVGGGGDDGFAAARLALIKTELSRGNRDAAIAEAT